MIHLLMWLVLVASLGIVAAWVAENPGQVTIHWFDWRIDSSFAVLLSGVALAGILIALAAGMARRITAAPRRRAERRLLAKYRKGMNEITAGVASLAAGDMTRASHHTGKAEKYLGQTPLTLLLSAQVARSQGDETRTHHLLERMLEHGETEYIAARFLSDHARQHQLLPTALALAKRAHGVQPGDPSAVVSLHVRLGQWQEALAVLARAQRKGHLGKQTRKRAHGVVHLERGRRLLAEGRADEALRAGVHAQRYLGDFVPAVVFLSRALSAAGQGGKAQSLLLAAWKRAPHPRLAEALREAGNRLPADKRLNLMRKLAALQPTSPDGQAALAQAAMSQRLWALARAALEKALKDGDTQDACRLMAQMEQDERGDARAAGLWFARAANAPSYAWMCSDCSGASEQWQAHCPACHAFDRMEWKRRDIPYTA